MTKRYSQHVNVPQLGVMVGTDDLQPSSEDRVFHTLLCEIGEQLGIHVFLFSPYQWKPGSSTLNGLHYDTSTKRWESAPYSLPKLIYDRSFFTSHTSYRLHRLAFQKMQKFQRIPLLSHGLPGKYEVLKELAKQKHILQYLPPTALLSDLAILPPLLHSKQAIFLKPEAGTHGQGTVYIKMSKDRVCQVNARNSKNQSETHSFFSIPATLTWLRTFIGTRRYLVQPYLSLTTQADDAYDVRVLVQKDFHGRWQTTGMAVRQGQSGSMTSNLHGGGNALAVEPFLMQQFSTAYAQSLIDQLTVLALTIPPILEQRYGCLCELGIDCGIDQQGKLWMIEVNSKPGRSIFLKMGEKSNYLASIRHPLEYAKMRLNPGRIYHPISQMPPTRRIFQ